MGRHWTKREVPCSEHKSAAGWEEKDLELWAVNRASFDGCLSPISASSSRGLTPLRTLHGLVDTLAACFRPLGAVDPVEVASPVRGRQRVKETMRRRIGEQSTLQLGGHLAELLLEPNTALPAPVRERGLVSLDAARMHESRLLHLGQSPAVGRAPVRAVSAWREAAQKRGGITRVHNAVHPSEADRLLAGRIVCQRGAAAGHLVLLEPQLGGASVVHQEPAPKLPTILKMVYGARRCLRDRAGTATLGTCCRSYRSLRICCRSY
mmetsp:Transcript_16819/g.50298  ORF Transcript_16819/g.50298 Transcript_16819/m.50298 type:complete len:265 (-) Transcript_16819:258-1052(-)